jgi:hypothetical protein
MQITKVLLLVALLLTLAAGIVPAFAKSSGCACYIQIGERFFLRRGGCHFDQKTSQCVNISCSGACF